jgi:hypothetical protein
MAAPAGRMPASPPRHFPDGGLSARLIGDDRRLDTCLGRSYHPFRKGTMTVIHRARTFILLLAAACGAFGLVSPQERADRERLAAILEKSAEYCRRLDRAALDFVCLEEVTEMSRHFTPQTDVYLYDYQFIRKNGGAKEKRNLLAVNGKKKNIQDSSLQAVMFRYENVLFGPIGLLSKSWQADLSYQLVGEDTLHDVKAVVIDATPGTAFSEPHCFGKIWVKEDDGSVLKIAWDQRSLGNFQGVEEWAKAHDAEPQITAFSEYGFEKNGLRFPSRNYIELAYLRKDTEKFANAEISVLYKDYRFFTVETEIKY